MSQATIQETKSIRFMTGTWYTITMPADSSYDPEELYDQYWSGELPEDVEVDEDEVDHIWE